MKKSLVLLVLILLGAAAWAQNTPETGQWLHDIWDASQRTQSNTGTQADKLKAFAYSGYVTGASIVMWDAGWLNLKGTTDEQTWAVVGKYLDDHPEKWNLGAQGLVYFALYAVWPGKVAAPYQ